VVGMLQLVDSMYSTDAVEDELFRIDTLTCCI